MRNIIILPWLEVENANAVAGLTWGFPGITHFAGYTHALSRRLQASHGLRLEGCAIVCHHHQVLAYSSGRDYQFALTRNPLTREGETAPFNEEGRMHLTVSLLLECTGEIPGGGYGMRGLAEHMQTLCQTHRLAGGTITDLRPVQVCSPSQIKSHLFGLLPGYVLMDRSSLLNEHYQQRRAQDPQAEMIDAWLDFAALKMAAEGDETDASAVRWAYQKKPFPGYLVPLMTGWQRISPLYPPGSVANARDDATPFCFAEAVYGIGEWRGAHRIEELNALFWRWHTTDTGYYCRAQAQPDEQDQADVSLIFESF